MEKRVIVLLLVVLGGFGCTHQVHLGAFHGATLDAAAGSFAVSLAEPAVHDAFRLSVDGHHYEFSDVYTEIADAFRFKLGNARLEVFGASPDGIDADVYLYPELDFSFEQSLLIKTCRVRFRLTARNRDGDVLAQEYLQATETFAKAADGGFACALALQQVFPEVVEAVLGGSR